MRIWTVPFELLGMTEGAPPPARVSVRIAQPDFVDERAGGLLMNGLTFTEVEEGCYEPEVGGLYDEDAYGQLPRDPKGGIDFAPYRAKQLSQRPQVTDFGCLLLDVSVVHPWLRRHGEEHLLRETALSREQLDGLLDGRLAVDPQGAIRPLPKLSEAAPHDGWRLGGEALELLCPDLDGILPVLPIRAHLPPRRRQHRRSPPRPLHRRQRRQPQRRRVRPRAVELVDPRRPGLPWSRRRRRTAHRRVRLPPARPRRLDAVARVSPSR